MMERKVYNVGRDELNALVYRCVSIKAITLPCATGKIGYSAVTNGDWLAWNARSEEVKRFARAAKKDLNDRRLGLKRQTDKYCGCFGHVEIGGKMFTLYPRCGCLVREDFVRWAESPKNWDSVLTPLGKIRESTKPKTQTTDEPLDDLLHVWKDMRGRVMKLPEPTKLMLDGEWNTVFDMRRTLTRYSAEIDVAKKAGCFYPVSKVQADHLAGLIAYRERNYVAAKNFFLDMGATCVKVAKWIQDQHLEAAAKEEAK